MILQITSDSNLRQLDRIRTENNFNQSINDARDKFDSIPIHVKTETAQFVTGKEYKLILRQIYIIKVYKQHV